MKYLMKLENFTKSKIYLKYFNAENKWFAFADDNLRIHKIKNGANKDKIIFATPYRENEVETWSKQSLMLGCTSLLDTEHENNPEVRKIEIGGMKFRKIQNTTLGAISRYFLMQMGFSKERVNIIYNGLRILRPIFVDELRKLAETAKNLGEVIDGLKIIREEFFNSNKDEYDAWRLDTDTKKYNL